MSGLFSYVKVERDPPVPIPNTEVKPLRADGTWLGSRPAARGAGYRQAEERPGE